VDHEARSRVRGLLFEEHKDKGEDS
jgi:hypothetical protein